MEDDIEIWRRFKVGESAKAIALAHKITIDTVLRIVLLTEQQIGSSVLFYEQGFDAEGCPSPTPRNNVQIPTGNKNLEKWLIAN